MVRRVLAMTTRNPNSDDALDAYLSVVGPLMERAGAKLISRYEVGEKISGSELPQYLSIIEYPDENAVRQVFHDPSYIALKSVRDEAFSHYDVSMVNELF